MYINYQAPGSRFNLLSIETSEESPGSGSRSYFTCFQVSEDDFNRVGKQHIPGFLESFPYKTSASALTPTPDPLLFVSILCYMFSFECNLCQTIKCLGFHQIAFLWPLPIPLSLFFPFDGVPLLNVLCSKQFSTFLLLNVLCSEQFSTFLLLNEHCSEQFSL